MKTDNKTIKTPLERLQALNDDFEGLGLEELKKRIIETFYLTYGHYRNMGQSMFVEIYHNGESKDGKPTSGSVIWRKGLVDGEFEELTLTREEAIPKFFDTIEYGYDRTFGGVTREDLDKGLAELELKKSSLARERKLGKYVRGKNFYIVSEFNKGLFSVELGYDDRIHSATHDLDDYDARLKIDEIIESGFVKDGEEEKELEVDVFAAFVVSAKTKNNKKEKETLDSTPAWLKAFTGK